MTTNENDRLRLFEVPFRFSISGTAMILAADEAKAADIARDGLVFDEAALPDSNLLWDRDDAPILKDGIRHSEEIDRPTLSIEKVEDYRDSFDRDLLIRAGYSPLPEAGTGGGTSGVPHPDQKPFDEDRDGGEPVPRAAAPAPQAGPPIGPKGSREVKEEQPTGAPTTATTSAGAVAPSVNRPQPSVPPRTTTSAPRPTVPPRK